jgi:hypothetical protein
MVHCVAQNRRILLTAVVRQIYPPPAGKKEYPLRRGKAYPLRRGREYPLWRGNRLSAASGEKDLSAATGLKINPPTRGVEQNVGHTKKRKE